MLNWLSTMFNFLMVSDSKDDDDVFDDDDVVDFVSTWVDSE